MEIHVVCVLDAIGVDSEGAPTGSRRDHIVRGVFTDPADAKDYACIEGGIVTTLWLDDSIKLLKVQNWRERQ